MNFYCRRHFSKKLDLLILFVCISFLDYACTCHECTYLYIERFHGLPLLRKPPNFDEKENE